MMARVLGGVEVKSTWYEKIGFNENPLEIDAFKDKENRTLFGRTKEEKEVVYRVMSQNMLFIEGDKGSGKTALLKKAIEAFKGKGKIIYVDSNAVNKKLNIEELLVGAKKYNPTKDKYPKEMILLLDNVEELSKLNNERIKYFFDQNYIKSVIFTGKSYMDTEFTESIRSRIGNRVIKLSPLSEDFAVDIIMDRLGDKNHGFLKESTIKLIYSHSNNDLKKFLMDTFLICEYVENNSKAKINEALIQKILSSSNAEDLEEFSETLDHEKNIADETHHCENCHESLTKIGEYFRCKNCDTFCTDCGAHVEDSDNSCPECRVKFE